MSERAVPFHCPYCGEQDLEPADESRAYHCGSCDRIFEVRFLRAGDGA